VVLNVVESDIRNSIMMDMWTILKLGGEIVVGVRSAKDVMSNIKGGLIVDVERSEMLDRRRGSYQKGFTSEELKSYVESILPEAIVENIKGMSQVVVKIKKKYK
jgi:hypothetical protein